MLGDRSDSQQRLLSVQMHEKDERAVVSRCRDCCLFPVMLPSGNNVNSRLHGTFLKDVFIVSAAFATLSVLVSILIGLALRDRGADAPVINVNVGQFHMIAALMLLTWFGWGYAMCSHCFYRYEINYVVILNLNSPEIDSSRSERYLSALGVARMTAVIALWQGVSLALNIFFWRYTQFDASAAVVLLALYLHLHFLLVPIGFERYSRLALRTTLLRCLAAPFFQVIFLDNIVGDVLTSAQGKHPFFAFL
jgi:hypothetical protein